MNPSHNILSDSVGPKTIFAASDPAAAASGGQRRDFDEEDGVRPSAEGEREREEKVVETVLSSVAARGAHGTPEPPHLLLQPPYSYLCALFPLASRRRRRRRQVNLGRRRLGKVERARRRVRAAGPLLAELPGGAGVGGEVGRMLFYLLDHII